MKLTDENYSEIAEKVIVEMSKQTDKKGNKVALVTTSKIRNLLAMTAAIYNEVQDNQGDKLSNDIISQINYLQIRCVYEAGRDGKVKDLVEKAELRQHIKEISGSKKQFLIFNRYMEALVAYRKFYGGKDE